MNGKQNIWKLKELCSVLSCDYKILGNSEVNVTGLELNSKEVNNGDAFFCIVGNKTDGHKFVNNAIERGSSCLFVEHELKNIHLPQVVVENTREAMSEIANAFYNYPSSKLNVVGITGTNGKTTITNIVSHVLCSCNKHCGLVGTNGIKIDGEKANSDDFKFVGRTTPEAFQLQKIMSEFEKREIDNVVMEVSSHAITQNRVNGIKFAITAFTNLSHDHLDYHKNMNNYFDAKALLFSDKYPAKRVICIDDEWGQKLHKRCLDSGEDVVSVSLKNNANFNLSNVEINFPLIGDFNKQNMLIAYAICLDMGLQHSEIVKALENMPQVEGRMQLVSSEKRKTKVFVDYCHTPDALKKSISSLKEECNGRVITVVGCGGDRDKDKRPMMGEISSQFSDYVIVTSDNPRNENPQDIINDIVRGMDGYNNFEVEVDRETAIKKAINIADINDFVLLAGKGHEDYQEVNGKKYHFKDAEIALKALTN